MPKDDHIQTAGPECLAWNCSDTGASLQQVMKYVEQEAQKSIEWYWANRKLKSFLSQWIQFLAVILTSAAAIVPIIGQITGIQTMKNALWASFLVGLAAALLGLDKAFGFSSGWARYVLTATNLRKSLEEFRMDWTVLSAAACPNPSQEQIGLLVKRATEFRVAVEGMVLQETKDWVSEFQNSLSQLEKDVMAQVTAQKAQREKDALSRATEGQPGSIQLVVPNADKSDKATLRVKLEGAEGEIVTETVSGSRTWVRLNVKPGQYQVTVSASVGGISVSGTSVVIVKPGEIAQPQISLPV